MSTRHGTDRQDIFETISLADELRPATPAPMAPRFSEFQHLSGPNYSTLKGNTTKTIRKIRSFQLSRFRPQTATPLSSTSWETVSQTNSSTSCDGDQENICPSSRASPTIPEPYASAEPFLSAPVNAVIHDCYKKGGQTGNFQFINEASSIPSTCTTPEIPVRSYKRPILSGRAIGELFNRWGSTSQLKKFDQQFDRNFDQHLEVGEWIKMLKDKADMVVESVQEPLPSLKHV